MSDIFEGDLIRPLGLVTMYFAYAEAELEQLLDDLKGAMPDENFRKHHSVGMQLNTAIKMLKRFPDETLLELSKRLKMGRKLFERRNLVVHSSIFSGGRLVSYRHKAPLEKITPEDLTNLAEEIFTWKEHINANRQRYLLPLLNFRQSGN